MTDESLRSLGIESDEEPEDIRPTSPRLMLGENPILNTSVDFQMSLRMSRSDRGMSWVSSDDEVEPTYSSKKSTGLFKKKKNPFLDAKKYDRDEGDDTKSQLSAVSNDSELEFLSMSKDIETMKSTDELRVYSGTSRKSDSSIPRLDLSSLSVASDNNDLDILSVSSHEKQDKLSGNTSVDDLLEQAGRPSLTKTLSQGSGSSSVFAKLTDYAITTNKEAKKSIPTTTTTTTSSRSISQPRLSKAAELRQAQRLEAIEKLKASQLGSNRAVKVSAVKSVPTLKLPAAPKPAPTKVPALVASLVSKTSVKGDVINEETTEKKLFTRAASARASTGSAAPPASLERSKSRIRQPVRSTSPKLSSTDKVIESDARSKSRLKSPPRSTSPNADDIDKDVAIKPRQFLPPRPASTRRAGGETKTSEKDERAESPTLQRPSSHDSTRKVDMDGSPRRLSFFNSTFGDQATPGSSVLQPPSSNVPSPKMDVRKSILSADTQLGLDEIISLESESSSKSDKKPITRSVSTKRSVSTARPSIVGFGSSSRRSVSPRGAQDLTGKTEFKRSSSPTSDKRSKTPTTTTTTTTNRSTTPADKSGRSKTPTTTRSNAKK